MNNGRRAAGFAVVVGQPLATGSTPDAAHQLPLPIIAQPVGELVCLKWRAILGTKAPEPKGKK